MRTRSSLPFKTGKGASADHPAGARRWVVLPRVREQSSLCTVSSVRDLRPEHLPLADESAGPGPGPESYQGRISHPPFLLGGALAPPRLRAAFHQAWASQVPRQRYRAEERTRVVRDGSAG
ncbi:hypothetical protein EHS25_008171 [Saitozyma podzolica]|uniref:Uncharacterized protein n=1 Tax=Saitozyma podzolica TaxID=1890683 RepID=A0A427YNR8_9TREE|nr:hypothetical protein EHS25_008171 [Saitozyma podzolica]